MRASLTFRLFFILFSLMLAFWTIFIAYYYLKNDLSQEAVNPAPEKLAAISRMLDGIPEDRRQDLLDAIASPFLEIGVVAKSEAAFPGRDTELRNAVVGRPYADVLGDRLLHVESALTGAVLKGTLWDRIRAPIISTPPARALTFWLAVDNNSVLVMRSLVPVIVTPFGLPAGMGAGLLGTVFAFLAFVLFHREIYPLKKFAAAVERIDPAGETVELPKFRAATPEIGTLRLAFERLQARLQALTRSRMALIGGIQHDVRSFATRLRLRVEALPDESEREWAIADINDMIGLLDNALLTTRAGFGALDQQLLDLSEWLPPEISDLKSVGLNVAYEAGPGAGEVMVLGDRVALRRILVNLIENAVKYGESARVALSRDAGFARIAVEDGGPGFDLDQADLLLEPFVRAEPSRARNTGGAGLGLAVSVTLAEAHGGSIALSNHASGGRATLRLPLYVS